MIFILETILPKVFYASCFSLACFFLVHYGPDIMYWMYLYGPHWLGFWNGRRVEDICVSIVDNPALDSNFWVQNVSKCYELINHHFKSVYMSWLVILFIFSVVYSILTITYFIFLYGISKIIMDPWIYFFSQIKCEEIKLYKEKSYRSDKVIQE